MDRSQCTTFQTYNTLIHKCSVQTIREHISFQSIRFQIHVLLAQKHTFARSGSHHITEHVITYDPVLTSEILI